VSTAVVDFHFNDGYWDFQNGVFTPMANLYSLTAQLSTDALGAIVGPYSLSLRAGTFDPYLLIDQGGATAGHFGSGPCVPPLCSREPALAQAGTWSTTPVPEPSTTLLVMAGLLIAGWVRLRD
jgi:PEP-CTERM motif-containing protein